MAGGELWHVYPTRLGVLVGEERRIEEKKALFFCLDGETGREVWRQAPTIDSWWVGIEAVYKDTLFVHGFATPELPQHRGVVAVDLLTGNVLWEDPQLEFIAIADDAFIGSRSSSTGRAVVELDRRSGALLRELQLQEVEAKRPSFFPGIEAEGEIEIPMPLEVLVADDPDIGAAAEGHYDRDRVVGSVEAVEHSGYLIFDYHERSGGEAASGPSYANVIKVVDKIGGTLVYSDTTGAGLRGVAPELFFVQHDMLYYIKERRTLIAVRLASSPAS